MTRHNFDAQATSPRPALTCVCCGQPLDAYWQPALMPTKAGHWLVEDVNKACVMWMQTFSAETYLSIDLRKYTKEETA